MLKFMIVVDVVESVVVEAVDVVESEVVESVVEAVDCC